MIKLIGQTNTYETYIGDEATISFPFYQPAFLSNSDKKLCERWKKKYLKRNKLKKGEYIMLKDKY